MKYLLAISILFISLPTLASDCNVRLIHVSGYAETETGYDEAVVSLNIVSEDADLDKAKSDNNKKVKKLLRMFAQKSIQKKDITTASIRVNPRFRYINKERVQDGYQVSTNMSIKIRDIEKSNNIIDDLVKAGYENIYNVSYNLSQSKRRSINAKLKREALKNARIKAKDLASEVGESIGKTLEIRDESEDFRPGAYSRGSMAKIAVTSDAIHESAPEVTPGTVQLNQKIHATFELR